MTPALPIAEGLAKAFAPPLVKRLREWREQDEPKNLVKLLAHDHAAARKMLTQPEALYELWLYAQTGVFDEEAMVSAVTPLVYSEDEARSLALAIRDTTWQAVPDKRRAHFEFQRLLAEMTREFKAGQEEVLARMEAVLDALSRALPAARSLPAETTPFGDRVHDLANARNLLDAAPSGALARTLNATGMVGVGKSAFALRLAYCQPRQFPGGMLYLDLSAPVARVSDVAGLAASLLRDLGFDPEQIRPESEDCLRQLQSAYARAPVLLLLDNASADNDLQALIPAQTDSVVLVTSQSPVGSLAAASLISLQPMDERDALLVLEAIAGARVTQELDAAKEIVARCGGLPLALAPIAASIRSRPASSLAKLARRIITAENVVDALNPEGTLRRSLTEVIEALEGQELRLLLLIGALDIYDFDPDLLAAVLDVDHDLAEDAVSELADQSVLQARHGGGWLLHGLLRSVAADLARAELSEFEIAAASRRRADWLAAKAALYANRMEAGR